MSEKPPIVDMPFHALAADAQGPPPLGFKLGEPPTLVHDPARPWVDAFIEWFKRSDDGAIWSPEEDDQLMSASLAALDEHNIIAVASGDSERVETWRGNATERIIPALGLNVAEPAFSPEDLREMHREGLVSVLGEVTSQYSGVEPNDERFEPYLTVAEELDIPILIHMGPGPPGAPYLGATEYRARLHSPLLLEEPLIRHPKLRLCIAHAGWPMLDDTMAVLWTHPRVHVDVGVICYALPTLEFHRYLRTLVEAGFGNRILFGSDHMVWPGVIGPAIESIETASFLTETQKRAILYENAARFLRFDEEVRARHVAMGDGSA